MEPLSVNLVLKVSTCLHQDNQSVCHVMQESSPIRPHSKLVLLVLLVLIKTNASKQCASIVLLVTLSQRHHQLNVLHVLLVHSPIKQELLHVSRATSRVTPTLLLLPLVCLVLRVNSILTKVVRRVKCAVLVHMPPSMAPLSVCNVL